MTRGVEQFVCTVATTGSRTRPRRSFFCLYKNWQLAEELELAEEGWPCCLRRFLRNPRRCTTRRRPSPPRRVACLITATILTWITTPLASQACYPRAVSRLMFPLIDMRALQACP